MCYMNKNIQKTSIVPVLKSNLYQQNLDGADTYMFICTLISMFNSICKYYATKLSASSNRTFLYERIKL